MRTFPWSPRVAPAVLLWPPALIQFGFSAPGMACDGHRAFGFIPIFILAAGLLLAAPLTTRAQATGNEGDERKSNRWPRRGGWRHHGCFTGTL